MRPRIAPLLLFILALAACQPDDKPRPAPRPSSSASEPSPSGDVASGGRCTLVIGFSVTADWYRGGAFERQPGINDTEWEVIALGGHDVDTWADPTIRGYTRPPSSPCGKEPDRILFQLAAKQWRAQSTDEIVAAVRTSIGNIRAVWPTAEVVELIPIVGGPGAAPCPFASRAGVVDASEMSPVMSAVILDVANGQDIVAGPDLLLADCSQYRDVRGHLTRDGSLHIASVLAQYYGS